MCRDDLDRVLSLAAPYADAPQLGTTLDILKYIFTASDEERKRGPHFIAVAEQFKSFPLLPTSDGRAVLGHGYKFFRVYHVLQCFMELVVVFALGHS